jgi:enoyl-CoA hydratase/carnithine racemase
LAECVIRREVLNRIAFITLDRPAALNALNLDMIVQLRTALCEFAVDPDVYAVLIRGAGEKAFCAGGDIRAIYESAKIAHGPQLDFFETEYPLDYLLYSYPKPYIALIDGIVMGGGMGISQGSRLRIVGDRTRMAMPEVAIGFFPDVGASYFLSRLAGALGPYLALTGVQLRAADALYTGLADLYLPLASLPRLESELAALTWNTAANVPAVLKSLEGESRPEFAAWARQTIDLMHTRSPTMLAVTWEQLKRGRSMSLAACLRMELGLVRQAFFQGDFMEGVRAVIVDKDNAPVWRPTRIDEVTDEMVAAMFTDPWAGAEHPLAHLEGVHACS